VARSVSIRDPSAPRRSGRALGATMSTEKVILVRRARFVPLALCAAAIVLGIVSSPWWLLSVPCVLLGTIFTAPNLNLINGLPSYLTMVAGLVLMRYHHASGLAVVAGTAAGFYMSALEMRIFAKPYHGYGR